VAAIVVLPDGDADRENLLVFGLSAGMKPMQTREKARGADTVVILSGGVGTIAPAAWLTSSCRRLLTLARARRRRASTLIGGRLVIRSGGIADEALELQPGRSMSGAHRRRRAGGQYRARRRREGIYDHPRTIRPILGLIMSGSSSSSPRRCTAPGARGIPGRRASIRWGR
jgi:hypothetical protein